MAFFATLLALQAATLPAAPADWSSVPGVRMTRPSAISPEDTGSILRLVQRRPGCRAGIGPMPSPSQAPNVRMEGLRIEFLILVAPDGRFLNILASPGACDDVRNYGRAVVNARFRDRVRPPDGGNPAWYRTNLSFTWEP